MARTPDFQEIPDDQITEDEPISGIPLDEPAQTGSLLKSIQLDLYRHENDFNRILDEDGYIKKEGFPPGSDIILSSVKTSALLIWSGNFNTVPANIDLTSIKPVDAVGVRITVSGFAYGGNYQTRLRGGTNNIQLNYLFVASFGLTSTDTGNGDCLLSGNNLPFSLTASGPGGGTYLAEIYVTGWLY